MPMYLLRPPQCDPVVTWYTSVAAAATGRLGSCALGLPWAQERIHPIVTNIANPPLLKARCTCSLFHWYNHFATIFMPSIGLEQDLSNTWQSLSLLNTEISNEKSCPPEQDGLGHYYCHAGGTCVIIQTDCCVFIPDESSHVSSLLNHMRTLVNTLNDLTPGLGDLKIQKFGGCTICDLSCLASFT